jgi:3-hydroxyisobutyrate dehydrogenase-like beta-hydroxyacid dehydrogenase
MSGRCIGLLHPGAMGSAIAASVQNGNQVYWASEGRSASTHARAAELGLTDAGNLAQLCRSCDTIFSVCPPEFADEIADQVAACGFEGLFVDANAISPERTQQMDRRMRGHGVTFVDGGIVGPATRTPGTTWIYLSGPAAPVAAACFGHGPVQAKVIDGGIGRASAFKMCFAAYSKGVTALLGAVLAAAERLNVRDLIEQQWQFSEYGPGDGRKRLTQAAPKAWRFVPEMQEIAATFEAAGVTPEFHRAAAGIYEQLRNFKDAAQPEYEEIVRALAAMAEAEAR